MTVVVEIVVEEGSVGELWIGVVVVEVVGENGGCVGDVE